MARRSLEEELAGASFPTQFGRLLAELGIASIAAGSPQAKGRVERPWRTHQDRLVTELRLAGVATIEGANAFLPGYLSRYRTRFAVPPASPEKAYVPVGKDVALDRLFCFKYSPKEAADNTIQFGGRVLQLPPGSDRLSYAKTTDCPSNNHQAVGKWAADRPCPPCPPLPRPCVGAPNPSPTIPGGEPAGQNH